MALEPITRQEKIIAGQDLTPITRMEKFLKEFGGSGGAQPDWNAAEGEQGHILNRPFYSEVVESVKLEIGEKTITTTQNSSGLYMVRDTTCGLGVVEDNTRIEVIFDGKLYDLRSVGFDTGNRTLANAKDAEDTGEPFLIRASSSTATLFFTKTPGDHTIAITVYKEETVYHTIDPKFLPGGGGGDSRFVVNVTRDAEYKPSFDKTYEEIMAACIAEKEVVVRDGSFVYTLAWYDDDEGCCAFFLPGNQFENTIGFSIMRIKRGGIWEECGGTVNCTVNWTDTNKQSPE